LITFGTYRVILAANGDNFREVSAKSRNIEALANLPQVTGQTLYRDKGFMMRRTTKYTATALLLAGSCLAEESPPGALDLDAALARQSASDLISGISVAYDCNSTLHSFRKLGNDEKPVYLVEVAMDGPECEDALLLLARHGSTRDIVFRQWQPAPDVQQIDPIEQVVDPL
jgi:hypothetical protein